MTSQEEFVAKVMQLTKQIKLHMDIDDTNDMIRTANFANALLGKPERYGFIDYPPAPSSATVQP